MAEFNEYLLTLPDPLYKMGQAGNLDQVDGTPGPGYAAMEITAAMPNASVQYPGSRRDSRKSMQGYWGLNINYNKLPSAQFEILHTFLTKVKYEMQSFYVNLPQHNGQSTTNKTIDYINSFRDVIVVSDASGSPVVAQPGQLFRLNTPRYRGLHKITRVETPANHNPDEPLLSGERIHFWPPISYNVDTTLLGVNFQDTRMVCRVEDRVSYSIDTNGLYSINIQLKEMLDVNLPENSSNAIGAPNVPSGGSAVPSGLGSLYITWAAVSGALGYIVERSADGVSGWTQIADVNTNSTENSGLSNGTQYFYRVSSYNNIATSSPSQVFNGTTATYLLFDTFTDTDNTDIPDHTPEIGGTWETYPAAVPFILSNALTGSTDEDNGLFAAMDVVETDVTARIEINLGDSPNVPGLWGRVTPSGSPTLTSVTGYLLGVDNLETSNQTLLLWKYNGSSYTLLDAVYLGENVQNQDVVMELIFSSDSIIGRLYGSQDTYQVSDNDNTYNGTYVGIRTTSSDGGTASATDRISVY